MIASPDALTLRVRAAAREAMDLHHVPGMNIAVVHGDDLILAESLGWADLEARTPMAQDHRQCIASVTKTMVGLAVMALVDEGKLLLGDRVSTLLPDVAIQGPGQPMTVWHLLTHSGGIGEAQTQEWLAATVNPDQDTRRQPGDFASMYSDGLITEFEPGTKWHYANHGFNLLGEIVRRAEGGVDLHDVLYRRIFGPLGMAETDLLGQEHPHLTTPYHRAPTDDTREQLTRAGITVNDEAPVDGHNIRGKYGGEFNKAALPSGGVQSTLPDMVRYASALLRRARGIVRPETFDAMIAPQYCPDRRLDHWGLAFQRVPLDGRVLIGHGGAYFGGWNSHLDVSLDDNVAIIQHMNVMLADPAPVFRRIQRAVFDLPPPNVPPRGADPSVLEEAPGLYELTPGRLTNFRPATCIGRIRIEREGDGLKLTSRWGKWKHGVPLVAAADDDPLYFAISRDGEDPDYIALTRDTGGRVNGLNCDLLVRMVKVEEKRSSA